MLKLVSEKKDPNLLQEQDHHTELLDGYIQSHRIRNHSDNTIQKNKAFLTSWFELYGNKEFPLFTWNAMRPVEGRRRMVEYGKYLMSLELTNQTIRSYMGTLRSYFQYVLEHPYVSDSSKRPRKIESLYGPIEQPVSEYDIPQHSYDGTDKRRGLPLDPEKLYDFYSIMQRHYLNSGSHKHVLARNYAMAILAGESGLRADELRSLEISKDLFFESKKLQTRNAKAKRGSGKRARITLFTPLARDTINYYIKNHRPYLKGAQKSDFLFPSKQAGHHIGYSPMSQFLKEMIKITNKNGLYMAEHFGWHWFRRIFATRFIERFPNQLSVLMSLLGHSSPNTVHCYIHHSQAWMDKRIQAVIEEVEWDEY